MEEQRNVADIDVQELKAIAYDRMSLIAKLNHELQIIQQEIAKKESMPVEVE